MNGYVSLGNLRISKGKEFTCFVGRVWFDSEYFLFEAHALIGLFKVICYFDKIRDL